MQLLPLDRPELIQLAAGWLAKPENYKWLDFGNGVQQITPVALKIMTQRDIHFFRLYTATGGEVPVGIAGLTTVDRKFRTATLWAVLGDKRSGGCTREAVAKLLTLGFSELGLQAINAWAVETNIASQRVLEKLHFKFIGRQRRCHYMDGQAYDRLFYDLLAEEHEDI